MFEMTTFLRQTRVRREAKSEINSKEEVISKYSLTHMRMCRQSTETTLIYTSPSKRHSPSREQTAAPEKKSLAGIRARSVVLICPMQGSVRRPRLLVKRLDLIINVAENISCKNNESMDDSDKLFECEEVDDQTFPNYNVTPSKL